MFNDHQTDTDHKSSKMVTDHQTDANRKNEKDSAAAARSFRTVEFCKHLEDLAETSRRISVAIDGSATENMTLFKFY